MQEFLDSLKHLFSFGATSPVSFMSMPRSAGISLITSNSTPGSFIRVASVNLDIVDL